MAQGDLAGALKSFSDGLAIRQRLMSVHRQSGDNAKARDALRQGQAIMARLTKLSPDPTRCGRGTSPGSTGKLRSWRNGKTCRECRHGEPRAAFKTNTRIAGERLAPPGVETGMALIRAGLADYERVPGAGSIVRA
jgi:hypothetical protein